MIAREGLPFILIGLALAAVLMVGAIKLDSRWLYGFATATTILALFMLFFFRDPDRCHIEAEGVLIASADGKVVVIDTLDNHSFVGTGAIQISIFLSIFDVHVNRVPTDGVVDYVKYNPGEFFAAYEDKASQLNEQTEIGMTSSGGHKLVFKQIAGLIARRIIYHLSEGDTVATGNRFGMIRFGSRVDLILPADSKIEVKLGDVVLAGETVMGYLPSISGKQKEKTDGGL